MKYIKPILYALTLMAGILAGFIIRDRLIDYPDKYPKYVAIRDNSSKYTHPLLDVLIPEDSSVNIGLRPFERKVEKFIKDDIDKAWADVIAVYFRDLNNGPWFSIGETREFYPASLLKVPLMIAVLKQAETHPEILNKQVHYNNPQLQSIQNKISETLELGKSYTIEDLIKRMIAYSDNVSTYFLENFVDLDILKKTYIHLDLIDPYAEVDNRNSAVTASVNYQITIEKYASFFRVLYNASYLNREMSEKALGFLAHSDFKDGLRAGIPPEIEVSHKWGYREFGNNNEIRQLHDCGIVYYPDHPYLLCVMTAGSSYEYLDDAIREVARIVYEEIDSQNQNYKR